MGDIFARYIKMPLSIKGFVAPDENGDFNIYINKDLPVDTQVDALKHELDHIEQGDCVSLQNVCLIEKLV